MRVRIGVDFDNTIVCYDPAFHEEAARRGLIAGQVPARKEAVRDHLRACGREGDWTELQGYIYGPGMRGAQPFPGALEFFRACRLRGWKANIISHKTARPYQGPPYDLHASAQDWLRQNGFYEAEGAGLAAGDVYFELSKQAKLERIAKAGCDFFIDDLPEFLSEPAFPRGVRRILFDPAASGARSALWTAVPGWEAVTRAIETPDGARA